MNAPEEGDANLNTQDARGEIPIPCALGSQHEGTVTLLRLWGDVIVMAV